MEETSLLPSHTLECATAQTDRVIREHSRTFFWATAFLPPAERQAVRSLYAFCRVTDDLVDHGNAGLQDIAEWRARIALPAPEQKDPILLCWAVIRDRYGVDRKYERELIDGVQMDVQPVVYRTWPELERYCYLVASTVGLLSIPILGLRSGATFEQAAGYAVTLGIALQLTNILRDVGEDAGRGRVYLPELDLQAFGLSRADILQRRMDTRFSRLMQFEIRRARELYQRALPGIRLLGQSSQVAVGAAALLYRAILDEIEQMGYDVFSHRAHTSTFRKIFLMPGILRTVWSIPVPREKARP
jgi:phytoene synthase